MDGYTLDLVTCSDNRGFTKHYGTKLRFYPHFHIFLYVKFPIAVLRQYKIQI